MENEITKENIVKARIPYITLIQAFAILCVVIGHVTRIYFYPYGWYFHIPEMKSHFFDVITRFMYTFHMPLFVFISGYLCERSLSSNSSLKIFIKKRLKRLMIPFYVWGILYSVPLWNYIQFPDYTLWNFLIGRHTGHLWFLPMLLMVTSIYLLLRYIPKKFDIFTFASLVLLYFLRIKCTDYYSIIWIPQYVLFYWLGAKFFQWESLEILNKNIIMITIFLGISAGLSEYVLYIKSYSGSLRLLFAALFMVLFIMMSAKLFCKYFAKYVEKSFIIQFLSVNLLLVYVIHEPLMELLLKLIGWGNYYKPVITCSILFVGTLIGTTIIILFLNYIKKNFIRIAIK